MNMNNEEIKHAANSKYARRVEIDAMVSKLADDRDIEQDSL
jgi:hypothetical protein